MASKSTLERSATYPSSILSVGFLSSNRTSPPVLDIINNVAQNDDDDVRSFRSARNLFPDATEPMFSDNSLNGNLENSRDTRKGLKIKIQVFGLAEDLQKEDGTKFKKIKVRVLGTNNPKDFRHILFSGDEMARTNSFKVGETCEIYRYTTTENSREIYWTKDSRVEKEKDEIKISRAEIGIDDIEALEKFYYLACNKCKTAIKGPSCSGCKTENPTAEYRFRFTINIEVKTRSVDEAQMEFPSQAKAWEEAGSKLIGMSANAFQEFVSTEEGKEAAYSAILAALGKQYSLTLGRKKGDREWTVKYINVLKY